MTSRFRGTVLMAFALFSGVAAGAHLMQSCRRSRSMQRRREEHRDRIERWEGEGGALPGTVGTGAGAQPHPTL